MTKMRPMATVPKDGTFVILFIRSGYVTTPLRCEVARWYPSYRPLQPWQNWGNDSVFDDGGTVDDIIGWIPLPAYHGEGS